MNVRMKESKSSVTIRRRTHRIPNVANFLSFRSKSSVAAAAADEHQDLSDDDESDAFAEHWQSFLAGPRMIRMIMSSQKTLFWSLVAFRLLNALMIQTSYVPDEYWQSIEVAHRMAFGYGYLTWEWHNGLRGYMYPTMFAVIYKLLGILHMDSRTLVTKVPRLLQGLFAAVGDLYVFRLSLRLAGARAARWTLLFQLTSWFTFYCCTRTLTNSMEAVLTAVALYYYPWPGKTPRKMQWHYLTLVATAIAVRPTSAIVWFPFCALHVVESRRSLWRLLNRGIWRGFLALLLSLVVDWICYGKLVNVYYNFLEFNFLSDLGSFYGTHPWHWYLSQGLVILLGSHIFPLLYAARKGIESYFLAVIAWTVLIYSLLSHKEFRFLMGVLPLVMHVCGCTLHYILDPPSSDAAAVSCSKHENQSNNSLSRTSKESHIHWKTFVLICLISLNLPLALYTCLIHQRGTIDVMTFLYAEAQKPVSKDLMSVYFLMPCHSTPFYSYIHHNVTMKFLTCEPNLGRVTNYTDEADVFYRSPETWLAANNFSSDAEAVNLPTHLVMFDELHVRTAALLRDSRHGYRVCGRFFHTHFPDGRVSMYVVALCSIRWIHAVRQHSTRFFHHNLSHDI